MPIEIKEAIKKETICHLACFSFHFTVDDTTDRNLNVAILLVYLNYQFFEVMIFVTEVLD